MLELLIAIIVFGIAGYGFGRTVVEESFVEEFRQWVRSKGYVPVVGKGVHQAPDGAIIRTSESGEIEIISLDGYRVDIPRWRAFILGKIADLFDCVFCMSAQAGFQFAFWTLLATTNLAVIVCIAAGFGAVGITYVINDWLNRV